MVILQHGDGMIHGTIIVCITADGTVDGIILGVMDGILDGMILGIAHIGTMAGTAAGILLLYIEHIEVLQVQVIMVV
jgi:hypothetical protein